MATKSGSLCSCHVALLFSLLIALPGSSTLAAATALADDSLPGWLGERVLSEDSADAGASTNLWDDSVLRRDKDTGIDPFRVVQVATQPRAFVYKGFLSHEECDHLVSLARPKVQRSYVTDNDSGKSKESNIRTSSGMFLNKYQDDIVRRIEERIAQWTYLPVENGEAIQVLRYEDGQKYDAHFDYFHDKINSQLGGHRYATVLMYLSDVEAGGETVFPSARVPPGSPHLGSSSPCARQGIAVRPRKGDALLFYSLHLDGTTDDHSLHAGCPVLRGEKWSATKWIHVSAFETRTASSGCQDLHPTCAQWAAMGECTRNPVYMVGDQGGGGNCRKSCKKC